MTISNKTESKKSTSGEMEIVRALTRAVATIAEVEVADDLFAIKNRKLTNDTLKSIYTSMGFEATFATPIPAARSSLGILRGVGDAYALRVRHHDSLLHAQMLPCAGLAADLFNIFEQVRCEAIGVSTMPGIATNLANFYRFNLDANGENKPLALTFALPVILHDTLASFTAKDIFNEKNALPNQIKTIVKIIDQQGDDLKSAINDQHAFALVARKLINDMLDGGRSDRQASPELSSYSAGDLSEIDNNDSDQTLDDNLTSDEESRSVHSPGDVNQNANDKDQSESKINTAAGRLATDKNSDETPLTTNCRYTVYTSKYDEVVNASSLLDRDHKDQLLKQVSRELPELQAMINRAANRLQRRLMAKKDDNWDLNIEHGLIDSSKLARVITTPANPSIYKKTRANNYPDTVVTILVDNSGSMRGRSIKTSVVCVDIITRILERCGVAVEILGFTTKAWRGGNSRQLWFENDCPSNPGRLNDLRHIIYKTAEDSWRNARTNLGFMLWDGLLKENIDGEALLWAYKRLMLKSFQRKILMVISDGMPIDDSTLSCNPDQILDNHLRDVIAMIENKRHIELLAIGIGHDVTNYYQRSIKISNVYSLGKAMLEKLEELFIAG